jgi:CheY-like chemotaxis protein
MGNGTILIVDDDADIRDTLEEILVNAGHRVVTASDGVEALHVIRQQPRPGLVLLDLMMPVMDGYQFLEIQRADAELARIPVAVLTAGSTVDRDRTDPAPLLRKPIGLSALMAIVKQHC